LRAVMLSLWVEHRSFCFFFLAITVPRGPTGTIRGWAARYMIGPTMERGTPLAPVRGNPRRETLDGSVFQRRLGNSAATDEYLGARFLCEEGGRTRSWRGAGRIADTRSLQSSFHMYRTADVSRSAIAYPVGLISEAGAASSECGITHTRREGTWPVTGTSCVGSMLPIARASSFPDGRGG